MNFNQFQKYRPFLLEVGRMINAFIDAIISVNRVGIQIIGNRELNIQ